MNFETVDLTGWRAGIDCKGLDGGQGKAGVTCVDLHLLRALSTVVKYRL